MFKVKFHKIKIKKDVYLQLNIIRSILKFLDKLSNKRHVQKFVRHLNYVSDFVPYYAKLRENLKLRGNKPFVWEKFEEYIHNNVKTLLLPKEDNIIDL